MDLDSYLEKSTEQSGVPLRVDNPQALLDIAAALRSGKAFVVREEQPTPPVADAPDAA